MKNKQRIVGIISLILLIGCFTTNVKAQEYGFFGSLVKDKTYEWEVTALASTGSISTPYLDYGDDVLEQGDKFSVKIQANVSEITQGDPLQLFNISNEWVEFYLNGENKTTDINNIGIIDLSWTNWVSFFFLLPTTYTNTTGTFNYFEVLNEGFPQIDEEDKTVLSSHGYYEYDYDKIKQRSKLTKKSWTITFTSNSEYKEDDFTDPENWSKEDTVIDTSIEIRYNVETGLLVYLKYNYNWHSVNEIEGSVDDDTRTMFLEIQSTVLPTKAPFNLLSVLLSVVTIGLFFRKKGVK